MHHQPSSDTGAASAADQLHRARRLFFERGDDPGSLVPEPIRRSWRRCIEASPGSDAAEPLPRQELFSRRDAQANLRRHALPELEALAEALVPARVIVLLADPEGLILDAAGSDAFMTKAQRVALMPGVDWSERSRGTNAIGTALTECCAVTVVGPQHYLEQNAAIGCTGAPLLAPDGRVMGLLDVSGDPRCIQAQTVGLVRMAAQMIEHRMALDARAFGTEILRFAHDPALLGSHREALLWTRDGIVVGANRTALRVLGMTLGQLRDRYVEDLFAALPGAGDGCSLELRPHLMQPGRYTSWYASWVRTQAAGAGMAPPVSAEPVQTEPVPGISTCSDPRDADAPAIIGDAARDAQLARAVRVLNSNIPILVTGESGVGKEVFARQAHRASTRATGPFIAVNCAAVPEGLIEAELFGYEDGAFTGARRRGQAGLVREADGGVLFLDEIGDMPLQLQARLLRVLQDREVKPLGGGRAHAVDFALICATHRNLSAMAAEGSFRTDLYYRLQHFMVELPALRTLPDRAARIDEMLRNLLLRRGVRLSPQARDVLLAHDWPGNWRQLTAMCRTLAALAGPQGRVDLADLPDELRCRAGSRVQDVMLVEPVEPVAPGDLRSVTAAAIQATLQACGGNVSRAARMLGVHRSTLYRQAGGARRDEPER
ncbi:MAG: sigma-54-dependent Fis family transcriptional regulator [Betaproteobacteria bacterium]|nr:sigma-54-dependent Fis family transcriptional regulator [Betaproteobacteria bacterium]MBU6513083.1 sigma-54-dependent Fis family transcriptional regulator [Betaproteobacteria bacterium]MDE1955469.1 sigma-54-dependent Fis family transcriptional regulator [Betaproteobacteria bacterium]MDE2152850.1 sigma-54-dependent Fis family transcriptional regulator [Betaproteobacteria bacterium]MDE2478154.1 sigma-54-dependent Fis family transcriptional regulator [Betaproteobacteria bacterium]